jgi:hypothetical protein
MTGSCRALLWAPVAFILLTPRHSFAAGEAEPTEPAVAKPTAAPKTEPKGEVAPSSTQPVAAPSEDYKATKTISKKLLRPLLGCWQLDGQERWTISRLDASGAQVVTKLIGYAKKPGGHPLFPGSAYRAAAPSALRYDASQGNFGFSTAGHGRATLVVFKHSGSSLEASLFSKRWRKAPYAFTGNTVTLERCKAPKRTSAPAPPRLK